MSRPGTDADGEADEGIALRVRKQEEFAADLNARGYADVLVLRRENGRDVLTDARLAIVQYLDENDSDVESVSQLARHLERDKGAVSKDLRRLAALDVVEYEGRSDGEPKRPALKHDHVVIEPVVY